jgi:release factor glutamine methyltransferase
MAEPEVTLDRLLNHAGARLKAAGLSEPRREAWRIWADLHGLSTYPGSIFSDDVVPRADADQFRQAVDRRARGEPLHYVTGVAGFRGLTVAVDRRALIPRPETEGLVDLVLSRAPAGRVVDVGTGTGCVALALAEEGRYDQVVAVERSPEALSLARENRQHTRLGIDLVRADLLTAFGAEVFDAVVSNPPYLTEQELAGLDPSVREWEPWEALAAGPDGLAPTLALVVDALRVVRPGGWLALEVDAKRAGETARLAERAGWRDVTVHDDLFGRARYLLARRSEAV